MPLLPQQKTTVCELNPSLLWMLQRNPLLSFGNNGWNEYVMSGGEEKGLKLKKKKMFHVVDQKLTNKILQHLYQGTLWLWLQLYIIISYFHFIYF